MGTNYYWYAQPSCHTCGRNDPPIHIGKASAGWCFALHVIPEESLFILDDWKQRWSVPNSVIRSEYGDDVSARSMEIIITHRTGVPRAADDLGEEWFRRNHAEQGPHGLIRSKIGDPPGHCVGHEGMIDLIAGEFS